MPMLTEGEETIRDLQQELSLTFSQLALERDRADTAERKAKEAILRFKDANDARLAAQADAARLREELKLYKNASEEAQKKIFKAQNILKDVEGHRKEAEEGATKLRRKLRKLLERYFSPPSESEVRRSRGELDLPPESDPGYTVTMTRFPPSGDSTLSSSSSSECEVPRYSRSAGARTASARTTMHSPAQAHAEIPPDGFIPEIDASPGGESPSSTSPRAPPVPVPGDVPVLMIPEPRSPRTPLYDLGGERPHRKVWRRSSSERVSSSTRTSEPNAPEHVGNRVHRSPSVIPEVASLHDASMSAGRSMKQQGEDRVVELLTPAGRKLQGIRSAQPSIYNLHQPQFVYPRFVADSRLPANFDIPFVLTPQPFNAPVNFEEFFHEPLVAPQPPTPPAAPEASILPNPGFQYHPCLWQSGPLCDGFAPGKNREMAEHLRLYHHFVGHERDHVQCEWQNCGQSMQRMNVARHIVSRHLLAAAICRFCGRRFCRPDVVTRHERTCVPPA